MSAGENRDKFREWVPQIANVPWLRDGTGEDRLAAVGGAIDHDLERVRLAAKGPLPESCDAEQLAYVGAERQLVRGPSESEAVYRARLVDAWEAWQHAGSGYGILRQLRALGYDTGNGNPTLVQQNGLYFQLTASGDLAKGVLGPNPIVGGNQPLAAGVTEWWSFDVLHIDANGDQYNNRFALIFPSLPAAWLTPTAPPTVDPTPAEVNTVIRIVNQWRAGEARFMGIWVNVSGAMWGFAPATWGGGLVWGGAVVQWNPTEY